MRKLYYITVAANPTTFDARNAVCANERVVARPTPLHTHIRHYG